MSVNRSWISLLAVAGNLPWLLTGCRSEPVSLTVFHTGDLHGQVRRRKIDPYGLGGVARMATLLEDLRRTHPVSITLDAGDSWQGSWYSSIDQGAGMLRLFGQLGYDAITLGAHDQVPGPDALLQAINKADVRLPVLAANLDISKYADRDAFRRAMPAAVIKQVGDLKVGIIGLTTFDLTMTNMMDPVTVTDPLTSATRLALEMRPRADVLILMSHNGLDANYALASAIPGIDAMISGGTHRKTPKAWIAKNLGRDVAVIEAGQDGGFVGELDLKFDPKTKSVQFEGYSLHAVGDGVAEHPQIAASVGEMDRQLATQAGADPLQTVAHAEEEIYFRTGMESPLGNLIASSYRRALDTDLAIDQLSQDRPGLPSGDLSLLDLHDVVSPLLKLKVWKARGSDFSTIMNLFFTAKAAVPYAGPLGWLATDQVQWIWETGRDQQGRAVPAIKAIKIQGRTVDEAHWYRVALTDRFLETIRRADVAFHLGLDLSQIEDPGIDAWKAVADQAQKIRVIKGDDVRVGGRSFTLGTDLSLSTSALQWRDGFVQVGVSNQGLLRSTPSRVRCERAMFKSYVEVGTSEETWESIGEASFGALEAGQSVVVQVPWSLDSVPLPRFIPVRCELVVQGDTFLMNNGIQRVFKSE